MKITVYTITDCKFSAQEKDYLKSKNLPFEEKNLETNKDFLTEMLNISNNFAGTPVTMIEKDDGSKAVLKGFTQEEFDKELNMGAADAKAPEAAAAAPVEPPAPVPPAPVMPEPAMPSPSVMTPPPAVPEPPAPTMPPAAPEPSMPPAPTTPSIDETPVAPPAPAPVVPPAAEMPEAPAAMPPVAPEPVAPPAVVPTGAPSAAQAAPAVQANDDALNAILNNLQEKVNADAPKPPAA